MEASRADGPDGGAVSVVGGIPVPAVFELVNGFRAGARRALRSTDVRVDYSNDFLDESVCESIANRQIDAGSGVVFAAAGDCGTGALVAAGIRGVWGVGVDRDQSHLGPHILASVVKRFDHAAQATLQRYLEGTLPAGEDVTLGLDDDAVGLVGINPRVPPSRSQEGRGRGGAAPAGR